MDIQKIKELIEGLIPVSKKAGEAILGYYMSEDRGIQQKEDDSPITKADLASNTIICDALHSMSPEIPIVSEENENIPYEIRSKWEYCWVVDPLDGTKEFINRNGEFTTNIGLVHNQRVIAGIVYAPVLDELFYAVKGLGAFKVVNGRHKKIHAAPYSAKDKRLKLVCSRSHLNDATKQYVEQFDQPELVTKGSSLKFLIIAEGNAHAYPRLAPTMEWDTCAAQIILEEAGGQVVKHTDNQPLMYNKENLLNPFFIANGNEVQNS